MDNVYVGEGYVPAYQMSASPWVTSSQVSLGSTVQLDFPFATRFLIVQNTGASNTALAVGFTQNGLKTANSNYFILSGSESFSGELRTDRIFISGSGGTTNNFTLLAGLTFIPSKMLTTITGSNGFSGVG